MANGIDPLGGFGPLIQNIIAQNRARQIDEQLIAQRAAANLQAAEQKAQIEAAQELFGRAGELGPEAAGQLAQLRGFDPSAFQQAAQIEAQAAQTGPVAQREAGGRLADLFSAFAEPEFQTPAGQQRAADLTMAQNIAIRDLFGDEGAINVQRIARERFGGAVAERDPGAVQFETVEMPNGSIQTFERTDPRLRQAFESGGRPAASRQDVRQIDVRVPDKERTRKIQEFVEQQGNLRLELQGIRETFDPENFGFNAQLLQGFRTFKDAIGQATEEDKRRIEEFATARRRAVQTLNNFIRAMSGAAVSTQEANRLLGQVPNPDDPSATRFASAMNDLLSQTNFHIARFNVWADTPEGQRGSTPSLIGNKQVEREILSHADATADRIMREEGVSPDVAARRGLTDAERRFGIMPGGLNVMFPEWELE